MKGSSLPFEEVVSGRVGCQVDVVTAAVLQLDDVPRDAFHERAGRNTRTDDTVVLCETARVGQSKGVVTANPTRRREGTTTDGVVTRRI